MKLDVLLSRLDKVRSSSSDAWTACCPAHPDKNPSLAIRLVGDRLLIHCFAGCDPDSIVTAVGMDIKDLFPESIDRVDGSKPIKRRFMPQDVIQCLAGEATFIMICANDMANGEALTGQDKLRLKLAYLRFSNAADAAGL